MHVLIQLGISPRLEYFVRRYLERNCSWSTNSPTNAAQRPETVLKRASKAWMERPTKLAYGAVNCLSLSDTFVL